MAISSFGFACRPHFPIRSPLFQFFMKIRFVSIAATLEKIDASGGSLKENSRGFDGREADRKAPEWKKLNSKELGISSSMIAKSTRQVLNGLKSKGHEVYLVGGCVRDLIVKRTPKDFDIITSAELREVVRAFSRCEIVGKRFPICHVHVGDSLVEVSSFSTSARNSSENFGYGFGGPGGSDEDCIRWRNCLQRDFTINGLMYDPYKKVVYDYMGGIEDIRKAKVRTVIPARTSFQQDCARILRAIRISARLRFSLSRETAYFIKNLANLVQRLDKGRIMMEMNYMLAYGSAEASLRLLWKFGLLDIVLPIQAAYFVHIGFRRRDKRSNMLLSLFSNLDKLLAPDRPCHSSLWVAILAFHRALCIQSRDPLVVAAFSLAVHNGGDMCEAMKITSGISKPHVTSFCELSEPQKLDSQTRVDEVMDLAASVKETLFQMTDEYHVSKALAGYPQAPFSDIVFIPMALYLRVCRIFECVKEGAERGFVAKQDSKIDYESLAFGNLPEVRHTFARVVFDTVFPLNLSQDHRHT